MLLRVASLLSVLAVVCPHAVGAQPAVASGPQEDVEKTLAGLQAPAWEQRASSLTRLERLLETDPSLRANPEIHRVVATALAQENAYLDVRYRRAGTDGEDVMPYPEGRSEYYDLLLSAALSLVDHATADTASLLLAHLVAGAYGPESRFAKVLALKGEAVAPAVTALASSADELDRINAYALMGEMMRATQFRTTRAPLASRSQAQFRATLRQGLQDAVPAVRMSAIKGIVAGRDRDAIPLLSIMAQTDSFVGPGRQRVTIRKLAQEAIDTLRK